MLILWQLHRLKSRMKALDDRKEDSLQVRQISFLSEIIDYNTLFTLRYVIVTYLKFRYNAHSDRFKKHALREYKTRS